MEHRPLPAPRRHEPLGGPARPGRRPLRSRHGRPADARPLGRGPGHAPGAGRLCSRPEPRRWLSGRRPRTVAVAQAEGGSLLFELDLATLDAQPTARITLPALATVAAFQEVLQAIAQSARDCALPALVLAGCTPPVDASVELITATPDPAVIEFNTAPSVDAADFLRRSREIYAAADAQGLAPYRLHFNGAVADSGGGGQITLGGPSPLASPFLRVPGLLPRLVRFFNRHPSLSYNYSHDFVGSSGQSARADERGADACSELALALHLLAQQPDPTPELLWRSLDPFLCDAVGQQPPGRDQHREAVEPQPGPARAAGSGGVSRAAHAADARARHRAGLPAARHRRHAGHRPRRTAADRLGRRTARTFRTALLPGTGPARRAGRTAGRRPGPGAGAARRAAARGVPPLGPGQPARLQAGDPARTGVLAAGR